MVGAKYPFSAHLKALLVENTMVHRREALIKVALWAGMSLYTMIYNAMQLNVSED